MDYEILQIELDKTYPVKEIDGVLTIVKVSSSYVSGYTIEALIKNGVQVNI